MSAWTPDDCLLNVDRDRIVGVLAAHAAAGRLSARELVERAGAAYGARSTAELDDVLRGLPRRARPSLLARAAGAFPRRMRAPLALH
jgi:hypothetical protein